MTAFDDKLLEIHRLLDEAYQHYFENSDGYCKSSEGHLSVAFDYGNYWDRRSRVEEDKTPLPEPAISVAIYSYVLGPSRLHEFDSVDDALEAVKQWHESEMEHDYSEEEW